MYHLAPSAQPPLPELLFSPAVTFRSRPDRVPPGSEAHGQRLVKLQSLRRSRSASGEAKGLAYELPAAGAGDWACPWHVLVDTAPSRRQTAWTALFEHLHHREGRGVRGDGARPSRNCTADTHVPDPGPRPLDTHMHSAGGGRIPCVLLVQVEAVPPAQPASAAAAAARPLQQPPLAGVRRT